LTCALSSETVSGCGSWSSNRDCKRGFFNLI
jgi:hypothetical protein